MEKRELALDLLQYIDNSPTMYQATAEAAYKLDENGFERLCFKNRWELKKGGAYYVTVNDSAIVAFRVGRGDVGEKGFRIVGSHTDSPTFKIKNNPIIIDSGVARISTEVYGGPIMSTWFDRPLSIAGRAIVEGMDGKLNVELVNVDQNLFVIPNLCIHMNREVNSAFNINPSKHTLPLIPLFGKDISKDYIRELVARNINVDSDKIINMDLYLYDRAHGEFVGENGELISVGRLDNLAMVHSSISAIIEEQAPEATTLCLCTDNEEVGSSTIQGADSSLLENILKRICIALGVGDEDYYRALANSFMISADLAHAYHPNFSEVADQTNRPAIGAGPVIKFSAKKSYTSDAFSSSIYMKLCRDAGIPYQLFANKSDMRGGSTIGPITESHIQIKGVDIGNAIWAMHSVRELGSVDDHYYIYKSFLEFFK